MTPGLSHLAKGKLFEQTCQRSTGGDSTYQISRLLALLCQTNFLCIPYLSICKTLDIPDVATFGPRGIFGTDIIAVFLVILKLYRGSMPCGFRQEDF